MQKASIICPHCVNVRGDLLNNGSISCVNYLLDIMVGLFQLVYMFVAWSDVCLLISVLFNLLIR